MSLAESSLMFVFQDVPDLASGRALLEEKIGLRLIENQFHPPHEHHGLVKYDVGGTIVSLNLFAEHRFQHGDSDGLTMGYRTRDPDRLRAGLNGYGTWNGPVFTDRYGHHYRFEPGVPNGSLTVDLTEIRLVVPELTSSVPFYGDVLGLPLVERQPTSARFATGTTDIVLDESPFAADGRPARYNAYLVVFHTQDVVLAQKSLESRGLMFSQDAGFSDIGGTARFVAPPGHTFCLYEPSAESLTWGSGDKVAALATRSHSGVPRYLSRNEGGPGGSP